MITAMARSNGTYKSPSDIPLRQVIPNIQLKIPVGSNQGINHPTSDRESAKALQIDVAPQLVRQEPGCSFFLGLRMANRHDPCGCVWSFGGNSWPSWSTSLISLVSMGVTNFWLWNPNVRCFVGAEIIKPPTCHAKKIINDTMGIWYNLIQFAYSGESISAAHNLDCLKDSTIHSKNPLVCLIFTMIQWPKHLGVPKC